MEDTVVLEFNLGDPVLPTRINPDSYGLWSTPLNIFINSSFLGSDYAISSYLGATRADKRSKKYCPRLAFVRRLSNGIYCNFLYVEFSVSKLLFGNNFQEFKQSNFNEMAVRLRLFLETRGIKFTFDEIINSTVKTIHYSINCFLPNNHTTYETINHLKKADIPRTKNQSEKYYSTDGESSYIYTNTKSVVLYDKVAELKKARKTENGNLEKDNYCQFDYLEQLQEEVLRFEVRFEDKKTILSELSKLGFHFNHQPTFKELINDEIAKKVLRNEYEYIVERIPNFANCNTDMVMFAASLRRLNPGITMSTLAKSIVAHEISRDSGTSILRKVLCENSQQWYEFKKSLSKIDFPNDNYDPLKPLGKRLDGL